MVLSIGGEVGCSPERTTGCVAFAPPKDPGWLFIASNGRHSLGVVGDFPGVHSRTREGNRWPQGKVL